LEDYLVLKRELNVVQKIIIGTGTDIKAGLWILTAFNPDRLFIGTLGISSTASIEYLYIQFLKIQ
jgi:hypothetical protein